MSSKERLCTHCGRFIAYDDAVRVCAEGGFAHAGCEYADDPPYHEPTEQDVRDHLVMIEDDERETEDHL